MPRANDVLVCILGRSDDSAKWRWNHSVGSQVLIGRLVRLNGDGELRGVSVVEYLGLGLGALESRGAWYAHCVVTPLCLK